MGVKWKHQRGNTEKFAFLVQFETDPDQGASATPDMAASWGAFQIWVRGKNLCAHREEGETLESVHWYLLPLLEWITANWEPLLHEEKLPERNAADDAADALVQTSLPPPTLSEQNTRSWETRWFAWRDRHAFQSAREGGLFPDVVVRRHRDQVEVSWSDVRLAGAPTHYQWLTTRGVERLTPNDVAEPLFEVLRSAAEYLSQDRPNSARVRQLLERVEKIKKGTFDERLAWMSGLGDSWTKMRSGFQKLRSNFSRTPNAEQALWGGLRGELVAEGSCTVALMFGSASPSLGSDDIATLAKCAIASYQSAPSLNRRLKKLVRIERAPSDLKQAYRDGYRLAEEALEHFMDALSPTGRIAIERIIMSLGIKVDDLTLSDAQIRAVSMAGTNHHPSIFLNTSNRFSSTQAGRRFSLAHELCHIMFDQAAAHELALTSGPWAPLSIERRANAFAAMLLMPTAQIQNAISNMHSREDSFEGIIEIANRFETSISAALEHVANLQQWDESTRERLRSEMEERSRGSN
jgi:Zn-dependent peptidase ImmA (M78 family)